MIGIRFSKESALARHRYLYHRVYHKGFTLIELLVVITIIGILSAIVLASLNTARAKARDALRAEDMHSIASALEMYYITYGCLPITGSSTCGPAAGTYSRLEAGTWDYSSQGGAGFMGFLKTANLMPNVPVDPVNNMPYDALPIGTYAFRYYCYPGTGAGTGVHLGYWSEITNTEVTIIPQPGLGWTDPSFTCN
jgi:prepilin-type N-terminal cleavage/methylation domain-containing protein